jgi:UDP-N-acetylmuramate dehydrogenase
MEILKHNIKTDILLKDHSTFKIGGPAKFFVEVDDLQRLAGVLKWAQSHQQKVFMLGGGSNILFMDQGFDGLIIKLINKEIKIEIIENDGITIKCGAGVELAKLVAESFKNSAQGLEWAIGIPGTVGGAVRGNAGAFGGEMKNIVKKVKTINVKSCKLIKKDFVNLSIFPNELKENIEYACRNMIQTFNNKECEFRYRESIFKTTTCLLIWEVEIFLRVGNKEECKKIAKGHLSKRKLKQPNIIKYPSAGSIFKNPKVSKKIQEKFKHDTGVESKNNKVPAGWLVTRCGLNGKRIGDAMIAKKHGNFIVNMGKAKASDVLILISMMKTYVRDKYGVLLREEISIVH